MIYKILIFSVIILALLYYVSIVMQLLSNGHIVITKSRIRFFRAIIPFYYWISGTDDGELEDEDERGELFGEKQETNDN